MGAKHLSEILKDLDSPEGIQEFVGSESSYRRGYIHGYDKGMDHMLILIREGLDPETAYQVILEYFNDVLQIWRVKDREELVEPPSFAEWRASHSDIEKGSST
jgi:hypothetical protein